MAASWLEWTGGEAYAVPARAQRWGISTTNKGPKPAKKVQLETLLRNQATWGVHLIAFQEFDEAYTPDAESWHLCLGADGYLALAGRKSSVERIELVHDVVNEDGTYRWKGRTITAYTPIAIFHVIWNDKTGTPPTTILNIHLHHMTAKRARGGRLRQGMDEIWKMIAEFKPLPDIMLGDFNMALKEVIPALENHGVGVKLIAPSESVDDSMGIFAFSHFHSGAVSANERIQSDIDAHYGPEHYRLIAYFWGGTSGVRSRTAAGLKQRRDRAHRAQKNKKARTLSDTARVDWEY